MLPRPSGIVSLLTDYGTRDPYVGVVRGMVLRQSQKLVLVDLGHEVPPQDVAAGAFWLHSAVGRFPAGTVHVAVVDPGVGTARALLAAAAHECYWLAPDNGILTHVLAADPHAEVRQIDVAHLALPVPSRTFHGRDVFAPVAGWLASGRYGFTALGPRFPSPVRLPGLGEGPRRIVHQDGFGNLITNVPGAAVSTAIAVRVAGREVALHGTYADVPEGDVLALVGSYGLLEVAVRGGSAAAVLGIGRGATLELVFRPGTSA